MTADDGLRGALVDALWSGDDWTPDPTLPDSEFWGHYADRILALREIAALRAKAAGADRAHKALDALSRETGAYEASYKGWAQQVVRDVRRALDGQP